MSIEQPSNLFGGLSRAVFLERYWQKQPLLVREALPGFRSPLSPEQLAGLACDEEAESRLVVQRGPGQPPGLRHGPFTENDFAELPETAWTLLVQEVEQFVPEVAALQAHFRFIPNWRMDDVMVSYATEGGGVGAHLDNYDVFLVQGSGRRKWQIDSSGRTGPEDFEPDQEWVLEPGDSLYLPPRIPHSGVALEPCMTFSIGCRAPTHVELVAGFLGHVVETMNADERYRDADLTPSDDPGRIAPGALQRVGDVIEHLFSEPRAVDRWFGRSVTEPKRRFEPFEPERRYSADELRAALRSGGRLSRSAVSHYAYILWEDETASLFVGGEEYPLRRELAPVAPLLAGATALDASALNDNLDEPAIVSLLVALIERGFLLVDSTAGSAAAADSEER